MKTLIAMKGEEVMLKTLNPLLEAKNQIIWTKLIEVEAAGVWIEGRDYADVIQKQSQQFISKTPIFFVPFAQIAWIFAVADYPYLSEKSFGLSEP